MKRALITGVLGQDGSYMAELLRSKGYSVFGTARAGSNAGHCNLHEFDHSNEMSIHRVIEAVHPDEIYNFAGVSNVFDPFRDLDGMIEINARLPQSILKYILKRNKNIKFFQASSCLVFGRDRSVSQNEETPRNPIHPYGAAKLYADNMIKEFREAYGIYACSGIFFNHESERRGNDFFSKKIAYSAKTKTKVKVGNMDAVRDFGYAPDYMEAAYLMMQNNRPTDYVIGTGELTSMRTFARKAFEKFNLDYRDYVDEEESLMRGNEISLKADIAKIKTELRWMPKHSVDDIIEKMTR